MRDEAAMGFWVLVTLTTVAVSVMSLIDLHTSSSKRYSRECRTLCQSSDYKYIEVNEYSFGQVDCLCASETVRFQLH
jgi:hypothetical protein